MNKSLYIIGSGGLGRELLATIRCTNFVEKYVVIGFIDEIEGMIKGVDIVGTNDFLLNLKGETL